MHKRKPQRWRKEIMLTERERQVFTLASRYYGLDLSTTIRTMALQHLHTMIAVLDKRTHARLIDAINDLLV